MLLVTSRQTRRWVLPKGNLIRGLSPHASAAHEALEEAGVQGAVCPSPIGQYRYRKRRGNGASLMVDVDVFPIAVTQELSAWEEDGQRDRRWFSPRDAADAVAEPELRQLILDFRAEDVRGLAGLQPPSAHWLQGLIPHRSAFFDLFEAQAAALLAGGDTLVRLFQNDESGARIDELKDRAREVSAIRRAVSQDVRRTFLTPFDRAGIVALSGAMHAAMDEMRQTGVVIGLYDIVRFDSDMRDMAAIIVECTRIVGEAMALLRSIKRNAPRLHQLTERLDLLEGQADRIHSAGVKALFQRHGGPDTVGFLVRRDIYVHLERVIDRLEDVADEINGLVLEHA